MTDKKELSLEEKLLQELETMKQSYELKYHQTCGYFTACIHYGEEEKYWQWIRAHKGNNDG